MLARNSDVDSAVGSVREVEDRFNHKYGYPWVFLNEQQFSDDFKRCVPHSHSLQSFFERPGVHVVLISTSLADAVPPSFTHSRLSNLVSGPVHFGLIPDEHWYQPDWVNETLATEEREKMVADNTIYGGSVPCGLFSYLTPLFQW
jgi:alpha 1,2-mannosyltransferase